MEFYENTGDAVARLEWQRPGQTGFATVPQSALFSAGPLAGPGYRFDGAGGTTADASGNGNVGTLAGGAAHIAGRVGGALALGGADDHVRVAASVALKRALTPQLTVAASAYRAADHSGWRTVATRQYGSSYDDQFFLGFCNNRFRFGLNTTGGYPVVGGGSASGFNGQFAASTFVTGAIKVDAAKPLLIGAGQNDATTAARDAFGGRIDDFQLFDRALTAAEVGRLYAGTL